MNSNRKTDMKTRMSLKPCFHRHSDSLRRMNKHNVSKVKLMEDVPLASRLGERVQVIVVGQEEMHLVIYAGR